MLNISALFTREEARAADAAAIKSGISAETLMQTAAKKVADYICQAYAPCSVLVVCGSGNNGGDGKIVSQLLKERGWNSDMVAADAFTPEQLNGKQLVVDAIFGTGLDRPIEGKIKATIEAINASKLPVVSIDIASGVNANTGEIMGAAIQAAHTVSFVRLKVGQVLLPGKACGGQLVLEDIGIKGEGITPTYLFNGQHLWGKEFPLLSPGLHKYARGHAVVIGGGIATTGAARLAATAALRIGAGVVSVACDKESLPIYAASLLAVMTKPVSTASELDTLLEDSRITAVLIGPGCGIGETTRERTLQLLASKKSYVIDADALTSFKRDPKTLFSAIKSPTVLTPHEGEFEQLFDIKGTKPERALAAAKASSAIVVFKGSDTVIAAPDGRVIINANAPALLATAGSGDVLAGMITGLLAQGMPAFEAACAAVWIHGQAANQGGPGLIAEDIATLMPAILRKVYGL